MINTGKYREFYYLQTAQDGLDFNRLANDFNQLLLGKSVAVLSFDADSMKPTRAAYERGWKYDDNEDFRIQTQNDHGKPQAILRHV